MHTLLPHFCSQTTPNQHQADWAHVQSWLGNPPPAAFVADGANPAATLQRGPSPRATAASMYGQRLKTEACSGPSRRCPPGFRIGPFRISPMLTVQCLASARANGNIPSPRRPVGTTLEERSIRSTCIASPPARADWGPKLKRCVNKEKKAVNSGT
jgi:hypothetical protein